MDLGKKLLGTEKRLNLSKKPYDCIISHYESCLDRYGDSHLGVDWPNQKDAEKRYSIMLGVIQNRKNKIISLLDFGCGASHLYEHIIRNNVDFIEYSGLDISEKFIQLSKSKYPQLKFYCLDILTSAQELPSYDYIIMNGVFTEKRELSYDEMLNYFKSVLAVAFKKANYGIAFNVMSSYVDWERDDLFHLPIDVLVEYLVKNITRHFIIRNDYGLYEYTIYLYKQCS